MRRTTTIRLALLLAVAFAALAVPGVLCDTLNVPGDYPNLYEAFGNASNGDTITLDDGYWELDAGNITVLANGTTLQSVSGDPTACVIGVLAGDHGFRLDNREGITVQNIGFNHSDGSTAIFYITYDPYYNSMSAGTYAFYNCDFIYPEDSDWAAIDFVTNDPFSAYVVTYAVLINGSTFNNTGIFFWEFADGGAGAGGDIQIAYCDFSGNSSMESYNGHGFICFDQAFYGDDVNIVINNNTFAPAGVMYAIDVGDTGAGCNNVDFTIAWNNFTRYSSVSSFAINIGGIGTSTELEMYGNILEGVVDLKGLSGNIYCNNITGSLSTQALVVTHTSGSDWVNVTLNNFDTLSIVYSPVLYLNDSGEALSGDNIYTMNWYEDYAGVDAGGDGYGDTPYLIYDTIGDDHNYINDSLPRMWPFNWGGWYLDPTVFSNPTINTTYAGYPCLFSCNITDPEGISGYIYSSNLTGSWVNSSWAVVADNFTWANFTGTLPAEGTWVGFAWYANSSADVWNSSGVWYFQTTDNAEYTLTVNSTGFIYADVSCWLNYTLVCGGGMNTSLIDEIRIQLSDGIWIDQNPAYNSTTLLSDPNGYCSSVQGYSDSYVVIINGTHLTGFVNLTMSMSHPPQYIYAVAYSMATDYGTDNASLAPWQYWATFSYVGASVNASYVMYYVTENVNIPQFTSPGTLSITLTTSYTLPTDVGVMGAMLTRMYSGSGSWGQYAIFALPVLLMLLAGKHNAAMVGMVSAAVCLFINIAVGADVYSTGVLGIIAFVCLIALFYERGKP